MERQPEWWNWNDFGDSRRRGTLCEIFEVINGGGIRVRCDWELFEIWFRSVNAERFWFRLRIVLESVCLIIFEGNTQVYVELKCHKIGSEGDPEFWISMRDISTRRIRQIVTSIIKKIIYIKHRKNTEIETKMKQMEKKKNHLRFISVTSFQCNVIYFTLSSVNLI